MNKKITAAFCAALIAVCAAGCGDVRETGEADTAAPDTTASETKAPDEETVTTTVTEKAPEQTEKKELTVDDAAKNVEEELDKVQKAAKGELEGGYKCDITFTAKNTGDSDIKPVSISVDAKQKDKLTGADYSLSYDSKSIISAKLVTDNESGKSYLQIPELSDGVLTGDPEEITKKLSQSVSSSAQSVQTTDPQTQGSGDLEKLKNIDFEALTNDLQSYVDTYKSCIPEPVDGDTYTVSADGVSIDLKTKSYTLTPEDVSKLQKTISDKGLADETLKSTFSAMGIDGEQYKQFWTSMTESSETENIKFDVYYNSDDEAVGIKKLARSSEPETFIVFASDGKDMLIKGDFGSQVSEQKLDGHLTIDGDTLNGSITSFTKKQDYAYDEETGDYTAKPIEVKSIIEYKSLTVTEENVSGDMVFTTLKDGNETMKINYSLNTTSENSKIDITFAAQGSEAGTISINTQKTDASDIKIPEGTSYDMTNEEEMNKYTEGCDIEGWKNDIKGKLGEDLYSKLFPEETQPETSEVKTEVKTEKKAV